MANPSGTKEALRSVPFFNYPWVFTHDEKRYTEIFAEVCRRGAYIMQSDLEQFEAELAEVAGVAFAIGVANCTDGLMLALRAAGVGAGDEVIFSSHTMTATAAAIHFVGAIPVPADCQSDHLIDPKSVQAVITDCTKAIMPTHLNGRTCAMERPGPTRIRWGSRDRSRVRSDGNTSRSASGSLGDRSKTSSSRGCQPGPLSRSWRMA